MTPLQSYLDRFLPRRLTLPALSIIYAVLLIGAFLAAASVQPNIYLDVGR